MPARVRNSTFYDKEQWDQGSWTLCVWNLLDVFDREIT